jgi:uncharacterized protein (DUF2062 family)
MNLLRKVKYYFVRLFRVKKGSKQISLGLVLGFFPCWFPTFGIGPAMSIGLTRLLNGSVVAAIFSAGAGTFLWPVLFYLNFKAGRIIAHIFGYSGDKVPSLDAELVDLKDIEYSETASIFSKIGEYGLDFIIGSIFNSIFFTIIGYFLFKYIFDKYRDRMLKLVQSKTKNQ